LKLAQHAAALRLGRPVCQGMACFDSSDNIGIPISVNEASLSRNTFATTAGAGGNIKIGAMTPLLDGDLLKYESRCRLLFIDAVAALAG
jgi:hypothetical protein